MDIQYYTVSMSHTVHERNIVGIVYEQIIGTILRKDCLEIIFKTQKKYVFFLQIMLLTRVSTEPL